MLLLSAALLAAPASFAERSLVDRSLVDRMPVVTAGRTIPMPISPGEPTVQMPNGAPARYRRASEAATDARGDLRAEIERLRRRAAVDGR